MPTQREVGMVTTADQAGLAQQVSRLQLRVFLPLFAGLFVVLLLALFWQLLVTERAENRSRLAVWQSALAEFSTSQPVPPNFLQALAAQHRVLFVRLDPGAVNPAAAALISARMPPSTR